MNELEVRAEDSCPLAEMNPHWSEWFIHAADVLLVLYTMRGDGKTFEDWLIGVAQAKGHGSMAAYIEWRTK
jgi:hypothetical protein